MNLKHVNYIIKATFNELIINIINIIDFLLPEFTIFTIIRPIFWWTIINIWKKVRIKRWLIITKIGNLSLWNNCYINRWNIFDNSKKITIWENCSIWYNNNLITTSQLWKAKKWIS